MIAGQKTFHAKRNWNYDETQLLIWAIKTYCKKTNN